MEKFGKYTKIIDLKNGVKNLRIRAIVLSLKQSRLKNDEKFYKLVIADKTACINCILFDKRAALLKTGDIIYMTDCYTKLFKTELTIYKFSQGNIFKIDEICMLYNDKIDMSAKKEASTESPCQNAQKDVNQNVDKKRSSEKVDNRLKGNFMNGNNYTPVTGPKRTFSSLAQSAHKTNRRIPNFKAFALKRKSTSKFDERRKFQ